MGLCILSNVSVHGKSHLATPKSKAHKEDSYPSGLGMSVYVVGETNGFIGGIGEA